MHTVGLKEAEGRLAELIDAVPHGEEVVVMREDGATFKIVPVAPIAPYPKFGSAKGLVKMAEDFDAPGRFPGVCAVRLLLDTHTFLWFISGDATLSPYAR